MKTFMLHVSLALVIVCCGVLSNGCGRAGGETNVQQFAGDGPIKIVCTTGQIADAVRRLGGERVQIKALMGPGVDPHLYQATLSDINDLKGADLIFFNGMHLEGRIADVLVQQARNRPTFAVTERIQANRDQRLRQPPEFEGHYDPHVWHNVELWSDCIRFVTDELAKFDAAHAEDYRKNADAYLAELNTLHNEIVSQIATIPQEHRVLVTAHDAFGYFGDAYGLEVAGLKGVSTEDEVSIQRTQEIVDLLVEREIPAVFVESAVAPRVVEALIEPCQAAGHALVIGGELFADALGPEGSNAETYMGMMRANVSTIVAALRGASVPADSQ